MKNFQRILKKIIKNPSLIIKSLKGFISFSMRSLFLLIIIRFYDRKLRLEGEISKNNGYTKLNLSKPSTKYLNKLFFEYYKKKKLFLDSYSFSTFKEIFDKLNPLVIEYLGKNAKLDNIMFNLTKKEDANSKASSNWHTDNVGARLKVFICFNGDGSQPTYIIPSRNKYPKTSYFLKSYLMEVFRWLGKENKIKIKNEISLLHKTGTINILDTNLLHRGCYENAKEDRYELKLEFSDPAKHFFARKILLSPIGTEKMYSFLFHKDFLKLNSFFSLLDHKRTHRRLSSVYLYTDSNILK